jgi:hypothetical protein
MFVGKASVARGAAENVTPHSPIGGCRTLSSDGCLEDLKTGSPLLHATSSQRLTLVEYYLRTTIVYTWD